MSKPAYTAVVLTPEDQNRLQQAMSEVLDNGPREGGFVERNARGTRLSHHMTLCMGPANEKLRKYLGKTTTLTILGWGKTDKALAVKVLKFNLLDLTKVTNPHITVAVNPGNGGAPKDSNDISDWTLFEKPFQLNGTIEEVTH